MKIAIFLDDHSVFIEKMVSKIAAHIPRNNLILYTNKASNTQKHKYNVVLDKNLNYLISSHHFKIYSNFLDYCEKNHISHAFIPRLNNPEMLLAELIVRNTLKTKISASIFGLQDVNSSIARTQTYKSIIKQHNLNKIFIFSIGGTELKVPFDYDHHKVTLFYDPIYESRNFYQGSKKQAQKELNLETNKTYGLYFGSLFYGKGIDILLNSLKKVNNQDLRLVVAGNDQTINFDYSANMIAGDSRVILDNSFISNKDMGLYFRAADFIVLPYRSTYTYGTSGVFVQSTLAHKPIICPDIYPFAYILNKYQLGLSFTSENINSLANAIENMAKNHNTFHNNAHFDEYTGNIQDWSVVMRNIIES